MICCIVLILCIFCLCAYYVLSLTAHILHLFTLITTHANNSIHIEYGAVPVVGVGHSCGSLLHMLITSLFPDTPRAANALISYNNRGVGEAVPFFEELIVPLFSDVDKNGSEFIKAMINVARMQINGTFIYVVFIFWV